MGFWLHLCQGRTWAFPTITVDGHAVCAGGILAGMVCTTATWAFLDLVLDFIYRRDIAIWTYFFWFGADGGNASCVAGSKRGDFWRDHRRHSSWRAAKPSADSWHCHGVLRGCCHSWCACIGGAMAWHRTGAVRGACLGIWSGSDPPPRRGFGRVSAYRVDWGYGRSTDAAGIMSD